MEFLKHHYGPEGMDIEDARAWAIGGCLETSGCTWKPITLNGTTYWIPGGAGQPTSVGVHFISMPKILELTLWDGVDQRTGERVFKAHGKKLETFDELFDQFKLYWQEAVDVLALTNNIQHDIWRKNNMAVINSYMKPDCLDRGHLINELGLPLQRHVQRRVRRHDHDRSTPWRPSRSSSTTTRRSSLDEYRAALKDNFGFKTAKEVNSFSLADQEKREDGPGKWDKLHFMALQAPEVRQRRRRTSTRSCSSGRTSSARTATTTSRSTPSRSTRARSRSPRTAPMGSATIATADGRLAGTTFADASLSAYPGHRPQRSVRAPELGRDLGPHHVAELPAQHQDPPDRHPGRRGRQEAARPHPGLHAQGRLPHPVQRGRLARSSRTPRRTRRTTAT